jgi:hypothetical protein
LVAGVVVDVEDEDRERKKCGGDPFALAKECIPDEHDELVLAGNEEFASLDVEIQRCAKSGFGDQLGIEQ